MTNPLDYEFKEVNNYTVYMLKDPEDDAPKRYHGVLLQPDTIVNASPGLGFTIEQALRNAAENAETTHEGELHKLGQSVMMAGDDAGARVADAIRETNDNNVILDDEGEEVAFLDDEGGLHVHGAEVVEES